MRFVTIALIAALSTACSTEPELSPEAKINREFAHLAWEMKAPLSATKCSEMGEGLAKWEAEHGARFVELRDQITTLHGADASNFGSVELAWLDAKGRCIHPEKTLPPFFEHDERVARVYAMFPQMETSYELR